MSDSVSQGIPAESPDPADASPKKGKAMKKAAASPMSKKVKASKPVGEKKAPAHPPTAQLVNEAIGKLNERGGSSLQAIKRSIADSHKIDVEKLAPFIRRYLKSAVEKGLLVQTKGKGASGSFRLPQKEKKTKLAAENPTGAVNVKMPADAKKAAKPKKPAAVTNAPKATAPAKSKASTASKVAKPKVAPKAKAVKAPVVERKPKVPKVAGPKKHKAAEKPKTVKRSKKARTVPANN